ncbi:MAG: transposase [Oscillospiraceae bacterium]|nr:transposase [Oscillospiraceae bacterium]
MTRWFISPHSFCSTELFAHIIYEKFAKAVPLYRQEKDFTSKGIPLLRRRSTGRFYC